MERQKRVYSDKGRLPRGYERTLRPNRKIHTLLASYLADENVDINMGNNFRWMTLYQLKKMTGFECSVNIEARTLLSIASYYKGEKVVY